MAKKSYLMDMDGVIVRGQELIPGADRFIEKLRRGGHKFLVLTNSSEFTPGDLRHRLRHAGVDIPEEGLYTSALATAAFLQRQKPGGTAFVLGEAGVTHALHEVGYVLSERDPDYVVVGESRSYNFVRISQALRLVRAGARLIATNPDVIGPTESGPIPACGALAALLESASGVKPYFVGKPNPLMMRTALRRLDEHSENAVMVGDRMDTDIVAGMESGMETVLVLSGVTQREEVERFPYQPSRIVASLAELEP